MPTPPSVAPTIIVRAALRSRRSHAYCRFVCRLSPNAARPSLTPSRPRVDRGASAGPEQTQPATRARAARLQASGRVPPPLPCAKDDLLATLEGARSNPPGRARPHPLQTRSWSAAPPASIGRRVAINLVAAVGASDHPLTGTQTPTGRPDSRRSPAGGRRTPRRRPDIKVASLPSTTPNGAEPGRKSGAAVDNISSPLDAVLQICSR
jgi:hypothetical protein